MNIVILHGNAAVAARAYAALRKEFQPVSIYLLGSRPERHDLRLRTTRLAIVDWALMADDPGSVIAGIRALAPAARVLAICSGDQRELAIAAGCDDGVDQVANVADERWTAALRAAARKALAPKLH
jgi:hypothetical protein